MISLLSQWLLTFADKEASGTILRVLSSWREGSMVGGGGTVQYLTNCIWYIASAQVIFVEWSFFFFTLIKECTEVDQKEAFPIHFNEATVSQHPYCVNKSSVRSPKEMLAVICHPEGFALSFMWPSRFFFNSHLMLINQIYRNWFLSHLATKQIMNIVKSM